MRDEVWLVYYSEGWGDHELHIVCSSQERADQYINDNVYYDKDNFTVEKHQVY